jgi:hypothetical protein
MGHRRKKELLLENQQLRNLALSLSAALLRKIAIDSEINRPLGSVDAERLVRDAEECFRCARIPGLKAEIADGLAVAGHDLMARAVEIESGLQRAGRQRLRSARDGV